MNPELSIAPFFNQVAGVHWQYGDVVSVSASHVKVGNLNHADDFNVDLRRGFAATCR
jgi:hypothetical protein